MYSAFTQHGFKYKFEFGVEGAKTIAEPDSVAVIVDVLSFTTCIDIATSHGAEIVPYGKNRKGAATLADKLGATVSGERGTARFSLSPETMEKARKGQIIILRSINGAELTIAALKHYDTVIGACLRNSAAVAEFVKKLRPETVAVIAAGEKWPSGELRPAFEDLIGAGAVLANFERGMLSPEAKMTVDAFKSVKDLRRELRNCESGRELIQKGYDRDIRLAGMLNASKSVPVVIGGRYRNKD